MSLAQICEYPLPALSPCRITDRAILSTLFSVESCRMVAASCFSLVVLEQPTMKQPHNNPSIRVFPFPIVQSFFKFMQKYTKSDGTLLTFIAN